ncbi:MAG: DUF6521 family protein [Acidobacteriota bacterium]|nr:DUF6521 family protein [Acidobacteriota bacterium]
MMASWTERPTEIANLLNPAFCALLLGQAVRGYQEEASAGLPYPLAFLILPLVLHKPTREALPNSIASRMHPWLESHQQAQVGFADRCIAVAEHTKEAIIYSAARRVLSIHTDARLEITKQRVRRPTWPTDSEPLACYEAARFVGRWLAHAGRAATIFAMWGIRP